MLAYKKRANPVAPRAGAWIEMLSQSRPVFQARVAPRAGAWIEIFTRRFRISQTTKSHPARVCGLKFSARTGAGLCVPVAPRAGAWIEMGVVGQGRRLGRVAPRAGAWIEIFCNQSRGQRNYVAPRAGAWIEILYNRCRQSGDCGRTPRGCVD